MGLNLESYLDLELEEFNVVDDLIKHRSFICLKFHNPFRFIFIYKIIFLIINFAIYYYIFT